MVKENGAVLTHKLPFSFDHRHIGDSVKEFVLTESEFGDLSTVLLHCCITSASSRGSAMKPAIVQDSSVPSTGSVTVMKNPVSCNTGFVRFSL